MEPITLISLGGLATFIAGAYFLIPKKNKESVAEIARDRAAKRLNERAFADTQPMDYSYENAIQFNLSVQATEIDGRVDGFGDLTEEQKAIIALVANGYSAPVKKESFKMSGPSASRAAGVPWSQSIFNEENITDYIEPGLVWPDHLTN